MKKIIVFLFALFMIFAHSALAVDCLAISVNSPESDKEFCKKELSRIEAELSELLLKQKEQQKNTGTLQGDVNYLTAQINALKARVQARTRAIAQLRVSISEKSTAIRSLEFQIARQHESLAQLIRNTNQLDRESMIHLILSDSTLSDFYNDLESYTSIKESIREAVDEIRGVKSKTEVEKKDLEVKQNQETDAKVELETAQQKVARSESEKRQLLNISKQKEAEYQKLAAEKKARADRIRAALFPLRDAQAIPFGVALQYAENAEKVTGVRSAFVLAILQQESNLGANVGSCVIVDLSSGETKGVNSGTVFPNGIHPTRDLPLLRDIVESLGRNPLTTRVSCPYLGGYGGAMGPAQFIPSTWNLIKSRLANALGKGLPDPWIPEDAIMASAMLLRDNGASAGGFTAERTAALKYYAGGNWNKPSNAFYGNQVMQRVAKIQADIDLLSF